MADGSLPVWILGAGLVLGVALVWRMLRSAPATTNDALVLSDLKKQRDETYTALRDLAPDAPAADREALELRAAQTLRQLEELGGKTAVAAPAADPEPAAAAPARGGDLISRHPLLAGTFLGGGMVGLVAILIFWAQGDARPDPNAAAAQQAPPARGPMQGGGGEIDRGEPPLSPQVQGLVDDLRARIDASPDDLDLRRSLAQILLENSQFFQAFGEAQEILARAPDDSDGLYISGLVRYTMGQPQDALELLNAALTSNPASVQASLIKGMIELQVGQRDAALSTWEGAQAASGGDYRLEHLLSLTRAGKSTQEILNTPPPPPGSAP